MSLWAEGGMEVRIVTILLYSIIIFTTPAAEKSALSLTRTSCTLMLSPTAIYAQALVFHYIVYLFPNKFLLYSGHLQCESIRIPSLIKISQSLMSTSTNMGGFAVVRLFPLTTSVILFLLWIVGLLEYLK